MLAMEPWVECELEIVDMRQREQLQVHGRVKHDVISRFTYHFCFIFEMRD